MEQLTVEPYFWGWGGKVCSVLIAARRSFVARRALVVVLFSSHGRSQARVIPSPAIAPASRYFASPLMVVVSSPSPNRQKAKQFMDSVFDVGPALAFLVGTVYWSDWKFAQLSHHHRD